MSSYENTFLFVPRHHARFLPGTSSRAAIRHARPMSSPTEGEARFWRGPGATEVPGFDVRVPVVPVMPVVPVRRGTPAPG